MPRFIGARLLQAVPLLVLVSLISFGLSALAPVDPARMALSAGATGVQVDERDVAAKRAELGLDRPLLERYLLWWRSALRFDFGRSFTNNRPVGELFEQRLPASAALSSLALALSVGLGVPTGLMLATRPGGVVDLVVRSVALVGGSLPGFGVALFAMWLFAVRLHWVPALGTLTPTGIVLPAAVLALRPLGRILRLVRAGALDVRSQEFVRTARAKGLSEPMVQRGHILPNVAPIILTVVGLDLTALFANAAVVEWVFAWPGVGRLGADAALAGDIPVLQAFVLIVGWLVVVVNLAADLLSTVVDPRLRATIR
jgi:ABC-type dipeptide/oligopeptide/nickel transport system permease component